MRRDDVLIVGGGPAGATCAWALGRAGVAVTVIDKARFPRDKVCAGWITPAVLTELEIDPEDYRRGRVLQAISGFRVGLMGEAAVDLAYAETVSYGIRRCEFDDYLLRRSGARLICGEAVRAPRREAGAWTLGADLRAPMLVGAGGHACPVARALGAHPAGEIAVLAREIEFRPSAAALADCAVRAERPELYFCRDLAGYGWCFRKGDFLNVGLGHSPGHDLARRVDDFVAFLLRERGVPAPDGRFHGHAYLLREQSRRECVGDGVLLVGDAAGLAYPGSGEGIRPAVESGLLAARVIIEADGDYGGERLQAYRARLRARFEAGSAIAEYLPAGIRAWLARRLFRHPRLLREILLDRKSVV